MNHGKVLFFVLYLFSIYKGFILIRESMSDEITDNPEPVRELRDSQKSFGWKKTFTALSYTNYRYWFSGQIISLLGTWMQITAQGFLVYELTHSAVYLGYVGFANGIPVWLFTTYAGVLADRYPKRSILIITQVSMMILATILSIMTFMHIILPWHIILLSFLLGIANAFDAPARQSFTLEMVERKDLINAIALNSTMFNTGTAVGPAIAGITYALFGPAWCFGINAISFVGVIIALLMMKLPAFIKPERKGSTFNEMAEGFRYLKTQKLIVAIIILVMLTCTFGLSFATLFPAWAVKILHGDAATNGFLQSARGVGSLISALGLAAFSNYRKKGMIITIGTFAFPILMFLFSYVRWIPFSLVLLVGIGIASLMILNLANGTIQTLVADEFRGRVMGIYSMTFMGFMPIGALIVGTFAHYFGEPATVQIHAGILLLLAIGTFLLVPQMRNLK